MSSIRRITLLVLTLLVFPVFATTVRMETSLGVIDIQLLDAGAPATVANFLGYLRSGAYDGSIIHRSFPGFIIQGGGYYWDSATGKLIPIPAGPPVVNEFSPTRSNLRGTIAMAKLKDDPNSATNEWFFNLANNSANLDTENGGFTVFGQVIGNGMAVVDNIGTLPIPYPSLDGSGIPLIASQYLVMVTRVSVLVDTVAIASGWNLLGNGTDAPINVTSTFSDANRFASVWKWNTAQGVWAFHSPALAAQGGSALADYAASKGYQVLTTIGGGGGFWVNAKQATSIDLTRGSVVSSATLAPALGKGWSLAAVGAAATPTQFCAVLGSGVSTLWAWDTGLSKWYFYSPSLDASAALASYISAKGYLDFTRHSKSLGTDLGFWVNKP